MHLGHIDQLTATIERFDTEVAREIDPFDEQAPLLCTIPGIARRTAEVVIAEIGVDMTRFPTAKHLASWAGLCPGHHESAGKRRSGKARKGDAALRVALCEAAWSAARTRDTYLAAQFRRFSRRMGKRNEGKAIFAVAHTLIVIIWHVLANNVDYDELGGDYFARRDTTTEIRRHVAALQRLGQTVTSPRQPDHTRAPPERGRRPEVGKLSAIRRWPPGGGASSWAARSGTCSRPGSSGGSPGVRARRPRTGRPP